MDKYEKAEMLTMSCEGVRLKAYQDSVGIWTIGVGLARNYLDGTPICKDDSCTMDQAKDWLHKYMQKEVYPRLDYIIAEGDVPDNVYAALACMSYNVGSRVFRDHEILETLGQGDWNSLAGVMLTYDKIHKNGQLIEYPELKNRRQKEIDFFLNNDGSLK